MRAGEVTEAQRALEAGLTALRETGERWCESELRRIEGELRLARGDTRGAAASFADAVATAASQGARALELRAALAFAAASKRGRELLRRAIGTMPAGFEGHELERARARLETVPARG